uniref:Cadherin domain-containing protein n=1 Tax=Buteo japonicus TaxID=224669 RepID=A0A8B9Z550_9AVES
MEDVEVGFLVHHIIAKDPDEGRNGQVTYHILSGNENKAFVLDEITGTVTSVLWIFLYCASHGNIGECIPRNTEIPHYYNSLPSCECWNNWDPNLDQNTFLIPFFFIIGLLTTAQLLDREIQEWYSLTVMALDDGSPALSATQVLTIIVLDVNDETPIFLKQLYETAVRENQHPGEFVIKVEAVDRDVGSPVYENLHDRYFTLNNTSGKLLVTRSLDREDVSNFTLVIECRDLGSPSRSSTAQLTLMVLDENDHNPLFAKSQYQISVREDLEEGSAILDLFASDEDDGLNGEVRYSLVDNTFGAFAINSVTGSIVTTKALDRETKSQYTFRAVASDCSTHLPRSTTVRVVVHIDDINDNDPVFLQNPLRAFVPAETPVNETVATVRVEDVDLGSNGAVVFKTSYKLVGSLVLNNVLDRETASSHRLVLLASDHGTPSLNSTATVLITVLDVNDNPPVFSSPEYHIHLKESIPVGSHVTEVSANDCDAGTNAEITYAIISGNDRGHFRLDGKTGSVDLMKILDYEDTMKFTLIIQATDGGADVKNVAFSVVLVSILDDNDYSPLFLFPSLSCSVSENLPTFSFVCAVNALDFDKGSYGHLTYSVQSSCLAHREAPRDHNMFFIDPLTGDIHTKQMFDYESQNRYCLIIQAKDKGDSLATVTVQVDIEGRDEFDPVFTQDQYFFNLPERNEAGQLLGRVTASDSDGGLDGVVHYSLLKTSSFFSVNQTSGNIYLTQAVHRKKNGSKRNDDTLELLVRAHSPQIESKFTVCTVLVNVSNSPESYPIVSAYSLTISISVSLIVFLLLAVSLTALILRHKWKYLTNACVKKEVVSSSCLPRFPTSQPLGPNNLLGLVQFHHLAWLPPGLY